MVICYQWRWEGDMEPTSQPVPLLAPPVSLEEKLQPSQCPPDLPIISSWPHLSPHPLITSTPSHWSLSCLEACRGNCCPCSAVPSTRNVLPSPPCRAPSSPLVLAPVAFSASLSLTPLPGQRLTTALYQLLNPFLCSVFLHESINV